MLLCGILQARILETVAIPFFRGSSLPGFGPGSPALQADCLLSEPPGKPGEETPAVKMPDWVAVSLLLPDASMVSK